MQICFHCLILVHSKVQRCSQNCWLNEYHSHFHAKIYSIGPSEFETSIVRKEGSGTYSKEVYSLHNVQVALPRSPAKSVKQKKRDKRDELFDASYSIIPYEYIRYSLPTYAVVPSDVVASISTLQMVTRYSTTFRCPFLAALFFYK